MFRVIQIFLKLKAHEIKQNFRNGDFNIFFGVMFFLLVGFIEMKLILYFGNIKANMGERIIVLINLSAISFLFFLISASLFIKLKEFTEWIGDNWKEAKKIHRIEKFGTIQNK